MKKFFLDIYSFLDKKRWFAYLFLILSFSIFVFLGLKVNFNENIADLLPKTSNNFYGNLAFNDLKVKDKIILQLTSKGNRKILPDSLVEFSDEFISVLLANDSSLHLIDNMFWKLDDNDLFNGLDFLLSHIPIMIDTGLYVRFDSIIQPQAIADRMKKNYDLLFDEGRSDLVELIQMDPVGLRYAFLSDSSVKDVINKENSYLSIINNHFFSSDSTVILAFLSPNMNSFDSKSGNKLVNLLENVSDIFTDKHPDVKVCFHGAPVQSVFNARQIKKDLLYSVGISLLIICSFIIICFKNKNTLLLLLAPIIYGMFFSLACVYLIQGSMSMLALGIGAIVLGVALSYVLHIITHYKYVNNPVRVIEEQAIPVSISCLTTIGAFVGLIFTNSSLLKDFGIFASFALIGTTLFSLLFLPLFFKPENNSKSQKAFAVFDKINSYRLDNKKWVIITICVVACISFYTSSLVSFDYDLKNIGYHEKKVLDSQKLYSDKINHGLASVYYATTASDLDSALCYNESLSDTLNSLKNSNVLKSYSQQSKLFVPVQVQKERIDAWYRYWNENKVASLMKNINSSALKVGFKSGSFDQFEALLESDYDTASLFGNDILPEGLISNIVEKVNDDYLVFTSVLMPYENKEKVNDCVASVPHAVVIDPFYYTNGMVKDIHKDFNLVLGISSAFVFIVLLVTYKNLVLALLAFLPMFLSWFIVQGMMGIFGIQFNLINIVISTFIFGIGVDYSIYIMDGLLADSKGEQNELLLCHKTAIFLSALVLVTVLGSLLFAKHPAIHSIGISTLFGMVSTVIIAYALQPYLFKLYSKTNHFKKYITK